MDSATARCLILCVLYLADSYRDEAYLTQATGLPPALLKDRLHDLETEGLLHHCIMTERWRCLADERVMAEKSAVLCENVEPGSIEYLTGRLAGRDWDEYAEAVVRLLDEGISGGEERILHFFELVLNFFVSLGKELAAAPGAKGASKYVQTALFLQTLCISTKKYTDLASRLGRSCYELNLGMHEDGLGSHAELLHGIVNAGFSRGNIFTDLLSGIEEAGQLGPGTAVASGGSFAGLNVLPAGYDAFITDLTRSNPQGGNYLASALYVCISHIAMHLQKYSLSSDLYQALSRLQGEEDESELSLTWNSHYCFVLLREGRFAEALERLEKLLEKARALRLPVAFASAARGIALYHFIHGNLEAAHGVLDGETRYAVRQGIAHAHFLDPLVLDMLYVFEQRGLPPIPRYELDGTIDEIMKSSNLLLKGAAQRVRAIQMRGRGANPRLVAEELVASRNVLHPERDKREITLSLHELANTLSITGDYEKAWQLRKTVAERLGCMLDSTTPYRVAALLATNLGDRVPDVAAYAQQRVTMRAEGRDDYNGSTIKKALRVLGGVHRSLQQLSPARGVEAVLRHAADVLQMELQCASVLIFQPTDSGYVLSASGQALKAGDAPDDLKPGIDWAVKHATGVLDVFFKRNDAEYYLCLDAGGEDPWIFAFFCPASGCVLSEAQPLELEMTAKFLATEMRGLLRLCRAQEEKSARGRKLAPAAQPREGKELDEVAGEGAKRLVASLEPVAATDAYVLIHGETGSGKEVVARQIHKMSGRSGAFISVNPASISETLFESEFFGHERGSFTGAAGQRKGYVELADQGTLFIDEVGEMPLSIQTKLLRVLQEQAFVRVGGNMPIRSDFRLITATNKDLVSEVRRGRFRQDLLHRIMVIPVEVPPLRARRDDIGQILDAFICFFSQRYRRPLLKLTQKQRKILYGYDWPGNVRELKNTVERMVIQGGFSPDLLLFQSLRPAGTLERGRADESRDAWEAAEGGFPSLKELEERYLRRVLEHTGGKVRGEGGAAGLLGVKTSTLYGKLKKLGISGG